MTYSDPTDMRKLNGLPENVQDPNWKSDNDLQYYLDLASTYFLDSISILKRDQQMSGSINGVNVNFFVRNYPIADQNFDTTINASDVDVYGWGNFDDLNTKTSLGVTSVDWREGRIVLTSAPSSTYDVISCDFRFYLYEPNWELFKAAEAYLAGQFFFRAEYMEIPDTQKVGASSFRITNPATKAMRAYYDALNVIRKKQFVKGKAKGTKLHQVK